MRANIYLAIPACGFLLGLVYSGAVCGQSADGGPAGGAGSAESGSSLEEIVVTARKREERLLDVPMSIEAFSGDALERNFVDNVDNLFGKVPSLYFSSNVLSPGKDLLNLVIRGVGAQSAGTPAVGTFVDGVYMPSLAFDTDFLDAERVEVLRGPQGTLFGRNTEGGALNIVLRKPDEQVRGKVALIADSFDGARAQAAISGPVAETLFGSIATDMETSDGYLKDYVITGPDGQGQTVSADEFHRTAARGALRYIATDDLEVNLSGDFSRRIGPDGLPGIPLGVHDYRVRSEFQLDAKDESYGGALTVDYKAPVALTSITGYRHVHTTLPFDFDGSTEYSGNVHNMRTTQAVLSEELRASGKALDDSLHWLGGAYVFTETDYSDRAYSLPEVTLFPAGVFLPNDDQHLNRHGVSAFTDVTYTPVQKLDVDAGLRYSDETTRSNAYVNLLVPDVLGPGQNLAINERSKGSIRDHDLSPTASLTYRWSKSFSTYARYAKGFRAGGFPQAPAGASSNIPFKAEHAANFELGAKADLWDHRLSLAASVYYIRLKDQQLSTVVFLDGNPDLPVASVGNAGRSRSQGVEFSADLRAIKNLDLSVDFGYTDAKYVEYVDTVGKDRAGERFPFVPKVTAQASFDYRLPLTEKYSFGLGGSYRYVGSILSGSGVDIDLQFPVPAYRIADAKASLIAPNWSIDLFCDNLADSFVATRVFNVFFYPPSRPFAIVLPPRREGVRFTYRF